MFGGHDLSLRSHQTTSDVMTIADEMAVEALRASEERFRAIIDHTGDAILVADVETHALVMVNRAGEELLGRSCAELLQMTIEDIHPKESVADVVATFEEQARNALPGGRNIPIQRADGTIVFADVRGGALLFDGRNCLLGVFRDATERLRTEAELRRSHMQIQLALDAAGMYLWQWDMRANLVTRSFGTLDRGWRVDAQNARSYEDFLRSVHPGDRPRFDEAVRRAVERGDMLSVDYRLGSEADFRWIRSMGRTTGDDAAHPTHLSGVAIDITDRRRMEEELLKVEKLESARVLAGGIAHDFNNLLTAILANVARARVATSLDTANRDRLVEAERAALRARGLTEQLLTFARGGAPQRKLIVINDLVREVSALVVSGSTARCELELADELWATEADEGQIAQVVQNLVLNAVQAMPGGGVVRVRTENVEVSAGERLAVADGRYVRISVIDGGVGISAMHLAQVFDPFFTTKQQGSGLGLAVTYSIVRSHDGCVTVHSEPDRGSEFRAYLPALEWNAEPASAERPLPQTAVRKVPTG